MTKGWLIKTALILLTGLLISHVFSLWPERKPIEDRSQHNLTVSQPNLVTFQNPTSRRKTKPESIQPKQLDSVESEPVSNIDTNQSTENTQALSFLAVYRMYRQWRTCRDFHDIINDTVVYDARSELENRARRINNKANNAPSEVQIAALHNHAIMCVHIFQQAQKMDLPDAGLKPGSSLSEPHLTSKRFLRHLRQLKPQNEQEQAIANVLQLTHQWNEAFKTVLQVLAGNDSQNPDLIAALNQEIQSLRTEQFKLLRLQQGTDKKDEPNEELFKLFLQIEQKEKEMQKLLVVDETQLKSALSEFSASNNTLYDQLTSNNPDVFYEAHTTLERSRNLTDLGLNMHKENELRETKRLFVEYVPPEDILLQSMEFNEPIWLRSLIPYATQLYTCELGADCGPDSEWIKHHCFNGFMTLNPKSCDSDLQTYYQQHLLSPNQWQDVQLILMAIRNLYET